MSKGPPSDCRSYEATLSEWIFEGTVEEKRLAPLKGHLKKCAACQELKNEFEKMKSLLQSEDIPPYLKTFLKR